METKDLIIRTAKRVMREYKHSYDLDVKKETYRVIGKRFFGHNTLMAKPYYPAASNQKLCSQADYWANKLLGLFKAGFLTLRTDRKAIVLLAGFEIVHKKYCI